MYSIRINISYFMRKTQNITFLATTSLLGSKHILFSITPIFRNRIIIYNWSCSIYILNIVTTCPIFSTGDNKQPLHIIFGR